MPGERGASLSHNHPNGQVFTVLVASKVLFLPPGHSSHSRHATLSVYARLIDKRLKFHLCLCYLSSLFPDHALAALITSGRAAISRGGWGKTRGANSEERERRAPQLSWPPKEWLLYFQGGLSSRRQISSREYVKCRDCPRRLPVCHPPPNRLFSVLHAIEARLSEVLRAGERLGVSADEVLADLRVRNSFK